MKCPNCGGEIENNAKFCTFCGSQITVEMQKEREQLNKSGCPKCGSTNVTFNREKQGELKGKNGTVVVKIVDIHGVPLTLHSHRKRIRHGCGY